MFEMSQFRRCSIGVCHTTTARSVLEHCVFCSPAHIPHIWWHDVAKQFFYGIAPYAHHKRTDLCAEHYAAARSVPRLIDDQRLLRLSIYRLLLSILSIFTLSPKQNTHSTPSPPLHHHHSSFCARVLDSEGCRGRRSFAFFSLALHLSLECFIVYSCSVYVCNSESEQLVTLKSITML